MTDFKKQVTGYLNDNRAICEELMCEGGYVKDWSQDKNDPFEYKVLLS